MSDKDQLLAMGFSEARVKQALNKTQNAGLQPALDYLFAHADDAEPTGDEPMEEATEESDAAQIKKLESEGEAKSLLCSDCGKKFKSTAAAEFHASKSGHENFEESTEEIKPLTEEEKKQKLEELRAAVAIKRAAKSKQDAEDAKQNEAIRRKAGKDSGLTKEALQLKEAEKNAAERLRDKKADAEAKARVKAQIEADKKERAEKAAKEKALREGKQIVDAPSSKPSGPGAFSQSTGSSSTTARIQIRLPDGPPLTTTLQATDTLNDVITFVSQQKPEYANGKLSMQFPRKVFGPSDMGKTLKELNLSPSAALILSV